MKYLWVLLIGLGLTACETTKSVLTKERVIVVVRPNEATYEMCPKSLDVVLPDDSYGGSAEVRRIYAAYVRCRQTVSDIRKEIDDLEQIATKDNPK